MRGSSGWFSCGFFKIKLWVCSDSQCFAWNSHPQSLILNISRKVGWRVKKEKQAALLAFSKLLLFYLQLHSSNFKIVSRYMVFRDSTRIAKSPEGVSPWRHRRRGLTPMVPCLPVILDLAVISLREIPFFVLVFLLPPQIDFDIANCDIKFWCSAFVSLNMKSCGKRFRFRFTASLRRWGGTWGAKLAPQDFAFFGVSRHICFLGS